MDIDIIERPYIEISDLSTRIQIECIEEFVKLKSLEQNIHKIDYENELDRKIMISEYIEDIFTDIFVDRLINIYEIYHRYGVIRLYDLSLCNQNYSIDTYIGNPRVQSCIRNFIDYIVHCFTSNTFEYTEEYIDYNEFEDEYDESNAKEIFIQSSISKYVMNMIIEITNCYMY